MYYVYVLKSVKYKKSYVGFSNNLDQRLKEHNSGKSFYTKRYKPWIIIYKEEFKSEKEAIDREKFYKTRNGRRELKKIFDSYLNSQ